MKDTSGATKAPRKKDTETMIQISSCILARRPYVLHTPGEGNGYLLTSEDAQRVIDSHLDEGRYVTCDARGVTLPTGDRIVTATLGGGVAFHTVAA